MGSNVLTFGRALMRRWWALMSSAILTLIGLYALMTGKNSLWTISVSFTIATVLFCVAAFLAWNEEHSQKTAAQLELAEERRKPPELDVRIERSYAVPIGASMTASGLSRPEYKWDIFLEAALSLSEPKTLRVDKCELHISAVRGAIHVPLELKDTDQWYLAVSVSQSGGFVLRENHGLTPLPDKLGSGVPTAGWLHFQTDLMLRKDLDDCNLRLLAYTERGIRSSQQFPGIHMENPATRFVGRKKMP